MSKPRLILYSGELPRCPCYDAIFNAEFDVEPTDSETDFLQRINRQGADAAVIFFCSARAQDASAFLRLEALSGPLPVLTCSQSLSPDFVQQAAANGVQRFLRCDMPKEQICQLIFEAMRRGGLRAFLDGCCPGSLDSSPHISKMIDIIVHTFPQRLTEGEMAQRLGISRRWLERHCWRAFGKSYTRLLRRIHIQQALRLMQHTDLDNTEIALQLNYSEESNMACDFRKELGYSPGEARRRLTKRTPDDKKPSRSQRP